MTVDDTKADGAIRVEEDTTPGFLGLRPPTTRCELSGTKLSIDYGGNFVFPFSLFQGGSKDLAVTLPSSLADHLDRLEINGASGSYTVDGAGCTELRVALASGRLTASNVQVDDLNLDMASGRLEVEGRIAVSYTHLVPLRAGLDDRHRRRRRLHDRRPALRRAQVRVPHLSLIHILCTLPKASMRPATALAPKPLKTGSATPCRSTASISACA